MQGKPVTLPKEIMTHTRRWNYRQPFRPWKPVKIVVSRQQMKPETLKTFVLCSAQ
jgi:hypothetical protein